MEETKYILINETEERQKLENLSKEEVINLYLDLLESKEDARLEGLEEYN